MRAEISDFDATGRVSDWYPYAIVQLGQNSTIRELNGAIACELLPHFENDPRLWESVTYIEKWNTRNDDFRSYLDSWAGELAKRGLHSQRTRNREGGPLRRGKCQRAASCM